MRKRTSDLQISSAFRCSTTEPQRLYGEQGLYFPSNCMNKRLIDWCMNEWMSEWKHWTNGSLTVRTIKWLTNDWLTDWQFTDCFTDWLTDWLIDRVTDWQATYILPLTDRPLTDRLNDFTDWLNDNENREPWIIKYILYCLLFVLFFFFQVYLEKSLRWYLATLVSHLGKHSGSNETL